MLEKNNPRLINAWASYDWSNSVYNLIVTTAIFPIYYLSTTEQAFDGNMVSFFGLEVSNSVLYSYAISFSFLVIVVLSPTLSGIADYGGLKKQFMRTFTYVGSIACIGLYFFDGYNVEYGISCAVLASIGYAGSLVFYNGFLPEVASADMMDKVSARGFSMGYAGSVILLVINLALYIQYEMFGFANGTAATQFGFILVGVWWLGFSHIAFYYLHDQPTGKKMTFSIVNHGVTELKKVFTVARSNRTMKRFLTSFFLFSMGVQTVMLLAPLFGDKEIGMTADEMIFVVLILQVLAIGGAFLFAWISNRKGNRFGISLALVIWVLICVTGYFLQEKVTFYTLAAFLGFVMGGTQSLARSTYAKLIPEENKDTASYFSFYDITEKLAIVIGSFSYGFIDQLTASMRNSMLFMSVFFIAGYIVLQFVNIKKTAA